MAPTTNNEALEEALADLRVQDIPNCRATAAKYKVNDTTLTRRFKGIQVSRQDAISEHIQCLTIAEEQQLIQTINNLTNRGIPPTPQMVKNLAEEVIGRMVGKNWTSDFVKRHKDELKSLYLQNIDHQRTKAEYAPMFKFFFDLVVPLVLCLPLLLPQMLRLVQLKAAIEKYNITADNLYNWDEKGFVLGQAQSSMRIMTLEAYQSGRITNASQDGSREFVTLLACMSAAGIPLPPGLIYKGKSHDLRDTWLQDWTSEDAYFAATENGWSCDALGLDWLHKIFDRHTKHTGRRRLLIVDGHSSHINLQFVYTCDSLRVLLLVLPPHTTHRLQPLDMSLFGPLATYYSQGLTDRMANNIGMVTFKKSDFWTIFWPAWNRAFTPDNIASGFEHTGIWPLNPSLVLDKIKVSTPVEDQTTSEEPQTPMTSHTVRHLQREYRKAPRSVLVKKSFRANERLAFQRAIDQHHIKLLEICLANEKKKLKKGKRLNLLGEEDRGPQFFSPTRIQAVRHFQATKDTAETFRQEAIAEKKALAAEKKATKEREKKERVEQALQRRKAREEALANKASEKQIQRDLQAAANQHGKKANCPNRKPIQLQQRPFAPQKQPKNPDVAAIAPVEEPADLATSHGRRVQRPRRFDN